jgi:hypothetical protein
MIMWILIVLLALIILSAVLNIRKRGFRKYILGLLVGIDQLFNAMLGGGPDETISSRCARGYGRYWYWTWLGKLLNKLVSGHIQKALETEINDDHKPEVKG